MYESATVRSIAKIREIAEAIKNGEEIYREEKPKELSVVWNSSETFREWRIGFNVLRAVARERKSDPRSIWVMVFITGAHDATQILEKIDQLENLKAFW